mmetsp:Transcript_14139/g.21474  ORF Transcript_14139/g.21474 Transcript_14139/m.21474 type:complete len:423 (-) Transcript_14139:121-1389(-)|eukprot:CAMPEP_0167753640 /NCGR_PEP_ID=MMETSP0110_2-20121227/7828_1 /TAXON_ID=629695 /ORGANISM="Gymnochlora sp., Strain CCMP2014" /LENGTH=422 /DNA_ID=CAMNT_0007639433 /DNA_START=59 /DNA_END=1327 /DNA_ORIENTATION=+
MASRRSSTFDRRRAALNYLRSISLGYETKAAAAAITPHEKKIRKPTADKITSAQQFHATYVRAPRMRRERRGWEEKLVDDKVIGSQVWMTFNNRKPITVFSVLHSRQDHEDISRRRRRDNLLILSKGGMGKGKKMILGESGADMSRRGRRGVSYGHLLSQVPNDYDPTFLCEGFKLKRHRAVMKLPGVVASVISFVRNNDRRSELNEQFRQRHGEWLTAPKMSLSKAKKIKALILEVAQERNLELSTAAMAYVYFERLVLRNVVSKYNRKAAAGAVLLLAFKYNEPLPLDDNQRKIRVSKLLDQIEKVMGSRRNEVLRTEVGALVHLQFQLEVPMETVLHFVENFIAGGATQRNDKGVDISSKYAQNLSNWGVNHGGGRETVATSTVPSIMVESNVSLGVDEKIQLSTITNLSRIPDDENKL